MTPDPLAGARMPPSATAATTAPAATAATIAPVATAVRTPARAAGARGDGLRREAARFAAAAKELDARTPVPTCPGWTVGGLVQHLGQGHGWAEAVVSSRTTTFIPPAGLGDDGDGAWTERVASLTPAAAADTGELLPALTGGAARLAAALDAVESDDLPIWAPHSKQSVTFWTRWSVFETTVHRADLDLLSGRRYELDQDTALDCADFQLTAFGVPDARPFLSPLFAGVPSGGERLLLRSSGTEARSWLITCGADGVRVDKRPAPDARADVTVTAAPAELLLVVKSRLRGGHPAVTVEGDRDLLDHWQDHAIS